MLWGSLDGRGVWGRMDTCVCMAESLFCPPETIPALLIGYTPIQNKKFGKNEKEERERRKGRGGQSSQRLKNWSPRPKGRGGQDPHNPGWSHWGPMRTPSWGPTSTSDHFHLIYHWLHIFIWNDSPVLLFFFFFHLSKLMATHSSNLAWKISWTEEPGPLQSMESERVRYGWATRQQHLFFFFFK